MVLGPSPSSSRPRPPRPETPPRSPASKKREAAIAVAVKCSPQSSAAQPAVVFCQPDEKRVWVQRGAQILFSSTFEVVLPSAATASETYTRTAEAPVRHACGGGQACVICYGAHGSGKEEAMCATPEAAADELAGRLSSLSLNASASDELGIAARAVQEMAAHAAEHGLKLSLSAVQVCFELATDLLDPTAAVGTLRGSGELDPTSLCGASRHQVG